MVASIAYGSLLFAVELPGVEDDHPYLAPSGGSCKPCHSDVRVTVTTQGEATQLLEEVRSLKRAGRAADAETLAEQLRGMGYHATVQRQHASAAGIMRLAHDFVIVRDCGSEPLVVDPYFREQFSIGRAYMTERYSQVLEAVPDELVASYSQLSDMVKLLCQEMKYSFSATGNSLPPWRSFASVLSRWSPAKAA